MAKTRIEWTELSWNPVTGCTKISPGCKNCYAEKMARRLQAMGQPNYEKGFSVSLHEDTLQRPLLWRKPKMIFVNSMSDLFHENIPTRFILKVFEVMKSARWHIFQVLTKRSDRLVEIDSLIDWPANVCMGVSVENDDYTFRIDDLINTSAHTKFVSFEPLLGPIEIWDYNNIDWVIVGGESGPNSRTMKKEWAVNIKDKCLEINIPFFFKQWGGFNKKKTGRMLEGKIWNDYPSFI